MEKKDGGRKPTDEEVADKLAQTMKDLASDDPKRREQAQEFLKKLDRNLKGQQNPDDRSPPKAPPDRPVPEKVKKELEKLARDLKGNDPKAREKAEEALKQLSQFARGDTRSGGTAPQIDGPSDPLEKSASDGRHRNQAGDLQLHKLDPKELRKYGQKLGLTEKQIDDAVNHDRNVAEKADKSQTTPGTGKALPTTGPTRVRPSDDNGPKVGSIQEGQPPIELRSAVKDFAKLRSEIDKRSKDK
ncbi:MAG TPA: hypothetical protein VKD72_28315 [Gemmataceae bacterium]|nr:hypothetical protein [Gemmataceae bacterium]